MTAPANPVLAEIRRGGFLESWHRGSAAVATAAGVG